jgi:PadR family transcriptional regulator PadR
VVTGDQGAHRGGGDREGTGRGMEAFVLLRLVEGPAHGYELRQAMAEWGFRRANDDPSTLYKLLRLLDSEGYLASEWAAGEAGPARRVYRLTEAGQVRLHGRKHDLARQAQRITEFLNRYDEYFPAGASRNREID